VKPKRLMMRELVGLFCKTWVSLPKLPCPINPPTNKQILSIFI